MSTNNIYFYKENQKKYIAQPSLNLPLMKSSANLSFNPSPADPGYTLPLQTVQIQISWLLNWSGSSLFAIDYVNLYQQSGSSNLIGWKLEVGAAS